MRDATTILWGGLVALALDDAIKNIAMLIRSYTLGKTSENTRCLSSFLKHINNFRYEYLWFSWSASDTWHIQHILRLLNTNVDGKRKVMYALTEIKGVGRRYSNIVCKKADVDLNKRCVTVAIYRLKSHGGTARES